MATNRAYIIAELSANHNNDLDLVYRTVKAMKEAGADAVKVQTYKPSSLTLDVDNEFFGPKKDGLWKGYRPWDLYREAAMPYEWHIHIQKLANELGLDFFSSPFDREGVDFLETLNVPTYKIASFEITDIPLIEYAASKMKPIIISTGVADAEDIQLAVDTCRKVGNNDITLLKCTSEYPATIDQANLNTIPDLEERFGVKVGVSDHTMGTIVPTVAVALGAKVIEKHFILDRSVGGPDSSFSMQPEEFGDMVKSVREAEMALGKVSYEVSDRNKLRRRSLFASQDIKKGEKFTDENVKSVRPGNGIHPKYFTEILGKKSSKSLSKGDPLRINHVKP